LGVAVVVVVSFAPVWNCEFVNWDDDKNFVNNAIYRGLTPAHLRWMFTTFHVGHYQPLSVAVHELLPKIASSPKRVGDSGRSEKRADDE
jgi:hypothetical protein